MVTDELLRDAALEAESYLASALPDGGTEPHEFSEGFEKKMSKLARRTGYPVGYRILRPAVVVFLVFLALFNTLTASSSEAQTDQGGWYKEEQYGTVEYSWDKAKVETKFEFYLTYLPEGCWEKDIYSDSQGITYVYVDKDDYILCFTYTYASSGGSLFLNGVGDYARYSESVNGLPADIYISPRDDETSAIVWVNTEMKVLFCLTARADKATLIRIAEGAQVKNY